MSSKINLTEGPQEDEFDLQFDSIEHDISDGKVRFRVHFSGVFHVEELKSLVDNMSMGTIRVKKLK